MASRAAAPAAIGSGRASGPLGAARRRCAASGRPRRPLRLRSRQRPRHPQRIAAAAAGFLVLAAAGGGVVALAGGNRVEKHDLLTDEISALSIDAGGGDVTVRAGGPPGTVEVTRKTRSATDLADLALTGWPGGTLTLNCATGCDIDYEIRVPAGVAVNAETGSGDIELEGNLGPVSLQTGSGDVEADIATTSSLDDAHRQRRHGASVRASPQPDLGELRIRGRRHPGAERAALRRRLADRVRRHGHRRPATGPSPRSSASRSRPGRGTSPSSGG